MPNNFLLRLRVSGFGIVAIHNNNSRQDPFFPDLDSNCYFIHRLISLYNKHADQEMLPEMDQHLGRDLLNL